MWPAYSAVGAAVLVVMALTPGTVSRDVLYVVLSSAVVVAILVGVTVYRPASPWPWLIMALGQLSWAWADAVLYFRQDVYNDTRFPSWPDPLYLAGYVAIAASLYLLVRSRRPTRDWPGFLDAATVTAGLGLLTWTYLAQPMLTSSTQSPSATVVSVLYVVLDIVLIGALVRMLLAAQGGSAPLRMLFVALMLLIGADVLSAALDGYTYQLQPAVELLWPASYVFWGAAALHPAMAGMAETVPPTERPPWLSIAAMTGAALVAPGILAVQHLTSTQEQTWVIVTGSVVMFGLVMVRMNLAIVEISNFSRVRRELQHDLQYQAEHDPLTGLPNRAQTLRLLHHALDNVPGDAWVAVLFLDLDGFKPINDTYGHRTGDAVLRVVAERLRNGVRPGDVATRLGGDEFVVILSSVEGEGPAVASAGRIITSLSQPINPDDTHRPTQTGGAASADPPEAGGAPPVRVGTSIGIALTRGGQHTAEELLHHADLALYQAKADGRGRAVVFGDSLREQVTERTLLELDLGQALENNELTLHYRPVQDLATGDWHGLEAVTLWDRPRHGLLEPEVFVPVAESTDLICRINAWVLRQATSQLAAFHTTTGLPHLTMTVPVSPRHLSRPRFAHDVLTAIADAGIRPEQLVLEITEATLTENSAATANVRATLDELRELGVTVSLGDYGRGYTALGALSRLPVDIVKIGGDHMDPTAPAHRPVLELMVTAAHYAGVPVIADNIHHHDDLALMRKIHCEAATGTYLGPAQHPDTLMPTPHRGRTTCPLSTDVPRPLCEPHPPCGISGAN